MTPAHSEFDLENGAQMAAYLQNAEIDAVLHGAAATSPPTVEKNPVQAMRVNIAGTAELAALCHEAGLRLVYVSTDYIFKGDRGQYREDDELLPQNAYAWSKLGGESAVHMATDSLIIRTSFSPAKFPFPKAFVDQYTSRDSVEVIAPIILDLTLRPEITGIVHVGTARKSVKDLALLLGRSDVADLRRDEVDFPVPYDTSLDLSRLKSLRESG
jgi:dTDP-4-dehydrorhamnose reductase